MFANASDSLKSNICKRQKWLWDKHTDIAAVKDELTWITANTQNVHGQNRCFKEVKISITVTATTDSISALVISNQIWCQRPLGKVWRSWERSSRSTAGGNTKRQKRHIVKWKCVQSLAQELRKDFTKKGQDFTSLTKTQITTGGFCQQDWLFSTVLIHRPPDESDEDSVLQSMIIISSPTLLQAWQRRCFLGCEEGALQHPPVLAQPSTGRGVIMIHWCIDTFYIPMIQLHW